MLRGGLFWGPNTNKIPVPWRPTNTAHQISGFLKNTAGTSHWRCLKNERDWWNAQMKPLSPQLLSGILNAINSDGGEEKPLHFLIDRTSSGIILHLCGTLTVLPESSLTPPTPRYQEPPKYGRRPIFLTRIWVAGPALAWSKLPKRLRLDPIQGVRSSSGNLPKRDCQ